MRLFRAAGPCWKCKDPPKESKRVSYQLSKASASTQVGAVLVPQLTSQSSPSKLGSLLNTVLLCPLIKHRLNIISARPQILSELILPCLKLTFSFIIMQKHFFFFCLITTLFCLTLFVLYSHHFYWDCQSKQLFCRMKSLWVQHNNIVGLNTGKIWQQKAGKWGHRLQCRVVQALDGQKGTGGPVKVNILPDEEMQTWAMGRMGCRGE